MWDAAKCDLCGDCLVKCLYVDYTREQAVADIQALREGKPAAILSRCVTCCACREYCPSGADPFDLILRAMEARDAFPVSKETVAMFDLAATVPSTVIPGDPDKPALSLCLMEDRLPEGTVDSELFQGMTIAKGGDYFCSLGYVHLGLASPLGRNAGKFIANLAALGKEIVFLHDDCYAMVHREVRDYGIEVPFRYKHLFEYLRDYLRDHRSRVRPLGLRVAYQRPCASRYTPEKDVFLDEIFELIGVEKPTRRYEGANALCCSAAIIRVYPDMAVEVQAKNIDDAIAAGAEAIITLCPMCDRVLRRPAEARGLGKIYVTDLCRIALGEKSFP